MKTGYERVAIHINLVQIGLASVVSHLVERMASHDQSKYNDDEKPLIAKKAKLDSLEYNSNEYREAISGIQNAVNLHYSRNRHHPEHFSDGVGGMNLIDMIEMICDWRSAATVNGTPIDKSLDLSFERFNMSPEVQQLIRNTYSFLEWQ